MIHRTISCDCIELHRDLIVDRVPRLSHWFHRWMLSICHTRGIGNSGKSITCVHHLSFSLLLTREILTCLGCWLIELCFDCTACWHLVIFYFYGFSYDFNRACCAFWFWTRHCLSGLAWSMRPQYPASTFCIPEYSIHEIIAFFSLGFEFRNF